MDKQHLKGAVDKTKGAVKDTAGRMTGNPRLQVAGKIDKTKGGFRTMLGDMKDFFRKRR